MTRVYGSNPGADPEVSVSGSTVTWGSHLPEAAAAGVVAILFGVGTGTSTHGVPETSGADSAALADRAALADSRRSPRFPWWRSPRSRGAPSSVGAMYAFTIPQPGGPEALTWTKVDDPVPAEGEVLVEVAATAVNRADLLQRQGHYNPPPGASPYPGLECSGRIAALGPGVAGWAVGDEVCALLAGGGYAEQVAVPVGQLLPIPRGLGLVAAAALPEVSATVWSNVFMVAHLRPGETVLLHGGASGIGTMATQLGKAVGAKVIVTAGSAKKLARCEELGADVGINYREQDFVEAVKEATGGHGVDVILDIMGAKYLQRNVDALAVSGRLVIIGLQGGAKGRWTCRPCWGSGRRWWPPRCGRVRWRRRRRSWRRCVSTCGR